MVINKKIVNKMKKIIPLLVISTLALSMLGYDCFNVGSVKNKENDVLQTLVGQHLETDNATPESMLLSGPNGVIDYNTVTFVWTGKDDTTCKENLLYSYMLEGKTDEWSQWTKDTSKTYENLSNGKYVFFVKAKDRAENIDIAPANGEFIVSFEEKEMDGEVYEINWSVVEEIYPVESPIFVSKHKPFTKIIRISQDNIKSVSFKISWKDDLDTMIFHFGRDTLTFSIKAPNGTEIFNEISTGEGILEYTKNGINKKPAIDKIRSKNESNAMDNLTQYYNTNWKNEPIEIIFDLKIGEIGIIRRLLDKGNDFDLFISYEYYKPELKDTGDNNPPDTRILTGPTGVVGQDTVTFSWIGIDDITPVENLQYSCILEGYEGSWSSWTTATSATYENLQNGSYLFKVKAKDEAENIDQSPAEQSFTVEFLGEEPDRFATSVVEFSGGGSTDLILGGPRGRGEYQGSIHVLTLGVDGSVTLAFDITIINGPREDFIISENPFFILDGGGNPTGMNFVELAYVEVSTDGVHFARFPSISTTAGPVGPYEGIYPENVTNLAGAYPVYANVDNNDLDPFDLEEAGGDAFDLDELLDDPFVQSGDVDLQNINYVRIIDILGDGSCLDSQGNPIYDPTGPGNNGADIDSVTVINYRL